MCFEETTYQNPQKMRFISSLTQDEKPKSPTQGKQDGEEGKCDQEKERDVLKEGKDSRESLRAERSFIKDASRTKDREKSAKGEKGEKEKVAKTGDRAEKSRMGSKLSVVDKPSKSGTSSPKGRRMSRMERPGADSVQKSKFFFQQIGF